MADILNKLYSYDNFGLYLIIAIIVLIILFFVILFYGKKDKKNREIETTRKLKQIKEEDAFKVEDNANKLEVETPVLEHDTIIVPIIEEEQKEDITEVTNVDLSEELQLINNDVEETKELNEELPTFEMPEEVSAPETEIELPKVNEGPVDVELPTVAVEEPILEKVEEKPLVFASEEKEKEEKDVPLFDLDRVIEEAKEVKEEVYKAPEVFSSVFVPEKAEETTEVVKEEKEEVKEDLDFELPTLKKEAKEEHTEVDIPGLKDLNLDNITGETYTIKK